MSAQRQAHDYSPTLGFHELLAQWLRAAGLELQSMTGMTYNPITKNYKLNPNDVSVNYLMHAKKVSE